MFRNFETDFYWASYLDNFASAFDAKQAKAQQEGGDEADPRGKHGQENQRQREEIKEHQLANLSQQEQQM